MHPNEPSLDELRRTRTELYGAESSEENMKKIRTIEKQIDRRKKEEADAPTD